LHGVRRTWHEYHRDRRPSRRRGHHRRYPALQVVCPLWACMGRWQCRQGGGSIDLLVVPGPRLVAGEAVAGMTGRIDGRRQTERVGTTAESLASSADLDFEAGGGGDRRVRVHVVQNRERPAVAYL